VGAHARRAIPRSRILLKNEEPQGFPRQTLTLGIEVQNPAGQPEAELYGGAILPDGRTLVFLSGAGGVAGVAVLAHPAGFVPIQTIRPGATLSQPSFFSFTFPPTGLPPGTYI
jgi:hypothetical protein